MLRLVRLFLPSGSLRAALCPPESLFVETSPIVGISLSQARLVALMLDGMVSLVLTRSMVISRMRGTIRVIATQFSVGRRNEEGLSAPERGHTCFMAKPSGTIQEPLTQQDLEYAADLLKWSRNLDNERISWELWEKRESESQAQKR